MMSCTCSKRLYPCPVHTPGKLPEVERVEETVYVIRIYHHWPEGSVNDSDKRWGYTVTKDAIKNLDSGAVFLTREQCLMSAEI
jgi:hypothetical protein